MLVDQGGMGSAATAWRARGASSVPAPEHADWIAHSHERLAHGVAAHPPPATRDSGIWHPAPPRATPTNASEQATRRALPRHSDRVLALVDDLAVPFTNNQAERDLRRAQVQQKIAGTFRSDGGATASCRLPRYLSTMRKLGAGPRPAQRPQRGLRRASTPCGAWHLRSYVQGSSESLSSG